jgi:hypothetical protein
MLPSTGSKSKASKSSKQNSLPCTISTLSSLQIYANVAQFCFVVFICTVRKMPLSLQPWLCHAVDHFFRFLTRDNFKYVLLSLQFMDNSLCLCTCSSLLYRPKSRLHLSLCTVRSIWSIHPLSSPILKTLCVAMLCYAVAMCYHFLLSLC